MNERLRSLYKTQILKNSRDETYYHELPGATHVLEAYNPMCGDQYQLFLKIDNGQVINASFKGYGCAISKASTAVLTKRIIGKKVAELKTLIELFLTLIDPDSKVALEELTKDEELLAFAASRDYPERKQCAGLSWEELEEFLNR